MFYSRSVISRKGPLGAIWVAAYYFKRLKKAQVFQTDISSSVDEILQNEFDALTYRVLAYLLLGLVRIYSKKVEYLFDECNDVLIKINQFVVSEKCNSQMETRCLPCYTITLPNSFELDAFDLEIPEDVGGGHVMPLEEITLKDGASKAGQMQQFFLRKYPFEEFAAWHDTCFADYVPAEDICASPSIEIDMNVSTSHGFSSLEASTENLPGRSCCQENRVNLDTFSGIEGDASDTNTPSVQHRTIDKEQVPEVHSNNEVQGERVSEMLQDERFYGVGEEPPDLNKLYREDHKSEGEPTNVPGFAQPEKVTCLPINEDNNLSNQQASTEKVLDQRLPQEICMDIEMLCRSEEPSVLTKPSGEEHHANAEPMNSLEVLLPGNDKCQFMEGEDPVSITVDATPPSNYADTPGNTTPQFMVVNTPATKERARIFKKRKCCLDDVTVFPNHLVRQYIEDASDLVSKRRKVPLTSCASQKALRISKLSQGFLVPLLHCMSSQLTSLFCQERLKIAKTTEILETLEPESPAVGRSPEQIAVAPETPRARSLDQVAIAPETPRDRSLEQMAIAPETPAVRSLEQMAVAPETPVIRSLEQMISVPEISTARSLEQMIIASESLTARSLKQMAIDPETPSGRSEQMAVAPETPIVHSVAITPSETPERQKNSHLDTVRPAQSFQNVEKEPSSSKDQGFDLLLMTEETGIFGGDDEELHELSARTRVVARYLHRRFLYHKKEREDEAMNLLQISEGKTKKESARLFYEILVLKTKGFVDVKQDDAYGGILIQKDPQWDQSYEAFCM